MCGLGAVGFADESAMVQEFLRILNNQTQQDFLHMLNTRTHAKKAQVLAGVVFNKMPPVQRRTSLPGVEYKLRFPSALRSAGHRVSVSPFADQSHWMTQFMFPMLQRVGPRTKSTQGGPPGTQTVELHYITFNSVIYYYLLA